MNRNCYRLVFNTTLGMLVPSAETARRMGKAASGSTLASAVVASVVLSGGAQAQLPGGFVSKTGNSAVSVVSPTTINVNQVGKTAINDWANFNVGAGNTVRFQQVDGLQTQNLVQGASFTSLNRIWDINPSVIAGHITQGAGQKATVYLVNQNGMLFTGTAQVNLNTFTASSLNIKDEFITNSLFGAATTPQFEGNTGFVKVLEGAKITADSQGRVMLIAPSVVNKGTISAPDGQVILAAGSKVYLRAAGDEDTNVRGLLVEVDSPTGLNDYTTANTNVPDAVADQHDLLGHATNLGDISAARGNVTMVGYAVNQKGIARATSSVVANGSVYLLAKDTTVLSPNTKAGIASTRSGLVVLGEGSRTEVLPEVGDTTTSVDGTTGTGLVNPSTVRVVGQSIDVQEHARIVANAGDVKLLATESPSLADSDREKLFPTNPTPVSEHAQLHIAGSAVIDVSGLRNVQVSAARNTVEVELRGDELKDSPLNRQGNLRGQTAYVDVDKALANADVGLPTLIAKDSLEAYQARLGRTVAERSTAGGTVSLLSEGKLVVDAGARIDVSGGSVAYTAATVKNTLLKKNGALVDLADARADVKYDGISSKYVIDYGRWNKKETIDLGQTFQYQAAYTEGKNAGKVNLLGLGPAYFQGHIVGSTVVGERQRQLGQQPQGATFQVGFNDRNEEHNRLNQFGTNQKVVIDQALAALPTDWQDVLTLDANLLGKDKVANLVVLTNQALEVRRALRAPVGGSVTLGAVKSMDIQADVQAQGGSLAFASGGTLAVQDGVTLSARGTWVNDKPGVSGPTQSGAAAPILVDGGTVLLESLLNARDGVYVDTSNLALLPGETPAEKVVLGKGVNIDASGGGYVASSGAVKGGKGGGVSIASYAIEGLDTAQLSAYGKDKGGKIAIQAHNIQIGGTPVAGADTVHLAADFFQRGGFADFALTALNRLEVVANTQVQAQVSHREWLPTYSTQATGSDVANFSQTVLRPDRVRQSTNITLTAQSKAVGTGDLVIGQGARVAVDPKGTIALKAYNSIDIEGALVARGGSVSAALEESSVATPLGSTILLGSASEIDVSGVARTYVDSKGLVQGEVLAGGTVVLDALEKAANGSLVAQAGAKVNVSGAAPVRLDVVNESGGLGHSVGSDAGKVQLAAQEGLYWDATVAAQGGSASNRGGVLDVKLSKTATVSGQPGLDAEARALHLATTAPGQAALTAITSANVSTTAVAHPNGTVRARIGTQALEAAGFEQMRFTSRDAIVLEDGLQLGASRSAGVPLRSVTLDAARIETQGGNASVQAHAVRLGNYDAARKGADDAYSQTGTLQVNARMVELAGNVRLRGMAKTDIHASESVVLAGVMDSRSSTVPVQAHIATTGDVTFKTPVVYPSTYTDITLDAAGHTVRFEGTGTAAAQPLSALGGLHVQAAQIEQAGTVWAPLGRIDMQATDTLTLEPGSVTSVAAQDGSVLPFGRLSNGRSWGVLLPGQASPVAVAALPEKSVRLTGSNVHTQAGATVDISGGGSLQGYEFTVGPGGSRDILTDANTYAVLPSYQGGFAPIDPQEGFDRALGESVYLSGVAGLPDGKYTLLPAHYALLPGAYAVRLGGTSAVLPGQSYTREDGIRVAAGYVTDSRAQAPRDANWRGIEVLTRDQVRERSEIAITSASDFFKGARNLPQDAGQLSLSTQDALTLDATLKTQAAAGGKGAAVDISAPHIYIKRDALAASEQGAINIEADKLNQIQADSLLLGATRSVNSSTAETTLQVGAQTVTLANDAQHALRAGEVMLAASDTVTLKVGSVIDAQGTGGDAGSYTTVGDGALLRAAATTAKFERTGSSKTQGTLVGEAGSTVRAASSVLLDATRDNQFASTIDFKKDGTAVAGHLAVGAKRISVGDAPTNTEGLTYSQDALNALGNLESLTLASYSTLDLYGGVTLGGQDKDGKPTWRNLTLQGAGLVGLNNAGTTATAQAKNLTLENTAGAAFAVNGALGSGTLQVKADTLTLGQGDKAVKGFDTVHMQANELVGTGKSTDKITNTMKVEADTTTITVARITSTAGADQALESTGALTVDYAAADRALTANQTLGAKWALKGTSLSFDTEAELGSGQFSATATAGDLTVGANARVDVAGRSVQFFDVTKNTWGGKVELTSDTGKVSVAQGAKVDVSGAAGANGGELQVRAVQGTVDIAQGSVMGQTLADQGGTGDGARVVIDAGSLASFSALNTALNAGGFDGERSLRVRSGDIVVAKDDAVHAQRISLAADDGGITVEGKLHADGAQGGVVEVYSHNALSVQAGAEISAKATHTGGQGGRVVLSSTDGDVVLAGGSIDVAGNGDGQNGRVLLRAQRQYNAANNTDAGKNVRITSVVGDYSTASVQTDIRNASLVEVEAVRRYNVLAKDATKLDLNTFVNNDRTNYLAKESASITSRLVSGGKLDSSKLQVRAGTQVDVAGDATLGADVNLGTAKDNKNLVNLTIRATGQLNANSNISDGFETAVVATSKPLSRDSATVRFVAGADLAAANTLATANAKDFTLAAGKVIRTGTGDIQIAAGGNITLKDAGSVVYTAGRLGKGVNAVTSGLKQNYTQGGGNVDLLAAGNIASVANSQMYSDWLFRKGQLNADGVTYKTLPSWWVRFDNFKQGVGAFSGGNVRVLAGGTVDHVAASAPTQGRVSGLGVNDAVLTQTGGGNVLVRAGQDVLGGQYFSGRGRVDILSGGKVEDTLLALGDAQAMVQAQGSVQTVGMLSPQTLTQDNPGNIKSANDNNVSYFSTFSSSTSVTLESLADDVVMKIKGDANKNSSFIPASVSAVAYQGSVNQQMAGATMLPAQQGRLELLAAKDVQLLGNLTMSDADAAQVANPLSPVVKLETISESLKLHAPVPVHTGDTEPVRIYAVQGNVLGKDQTSLNVPKAIAVRAGQDIRDLTVLAQNANAMDVSVIEAGRDIRYTSAAARTDDSKIWVGGSGRLEVTAGRDIDLGTSGGISSRGDLDNSNLPSQGVDIRLMAGAGDKGLDARGTITRLKTQLEGGAADDTPLWLARWLTGNAQLTSAQAVPALDALLAQSDELQKQQVQAFIFAALKTTGRDYNQASSGFAGDFARGYAALNLVFPGIGQKDADGKLSTYQGGINLFASRVLTQRGGSIDYLIPGGQMVVGLANTPEILLTSGNGPLGVVAIGSGDIQGFSRDSVLVNQSRMLTLGGGDVLLWSSYGDIDAGKGKKTASTVPPPVIKVSADGSVTQELQGAASGSGIGALSTNGVAAGDVDLIAPQGTVNAGDAGIRAGNINVVGLVVLGADNIRATGTSTGTPIADTSAITATASGATSAGDVSKVTEALSQNASDTAKTAQANTESFRPALVRVDVLGYGE
jgi:filamentous hemagglutinin